MLWPCSTGTPTARRSSMAPPTPCRWSTWCPRTGGRRWSMRSPAWSSGSRTSCACWSRCARRSAGGRSGSTAATSGATPIVGLEPLQTAAHLTGQLLQVNFLALDRRQALQLRFGLGHPALAAILIPLLTPRATGDHITLALVADLQEPWVVAQLHLLFQRQLGDQRLQRRCREPRHIAQLGLGHGLQVDPASHAAIKDEGRFGDPKATPQGMQEPLERLRVVPVAPQ